MRLSAFADEISPELDQQIATLREMEIGAIDLRSVGERGVLDLSDPEVGEIRDQLHGAGIRVAAIATPIGKTPIGASFEQDLERMERAVALAQSLSAPYIRLFSWYIPENEDPARYRDEVLHRLQRLNAIATARGVTITHENERGIYGDTIGRCAEIGRAGIPLAFDPANFLQCGQIPYPDAYETLAPFIAYVHVKDVDSAGRLVPAGAGEARWPEILRALHEGGYDGYLSLEPHLAAAGKFRGFTGPARFREASVAIRALLAALR